LRQPGNLLRAFHFFGQPFLILSLILILVEGD
jgi:hypothetical protein